MNADKLFESTPNTPEFYLPKLSNQAQKFGILMKKRIHWVSVVHVWDPTWHFQKKEIALFDIVLQY